MEEQRAYIFLFVSGTGIYVLVCIEKNKSTSSETFR
jgi:hypothetical protein